MTVWRAPLLILAGLTAIAGLAMTAIAGVVAPWPPIEWGLAGASLTFTLARIVHARRVTRRELELIAIAAAIFALYYARSSIVGAW